MPSPPIKVKREMEEMEEWKRLVKYLAICLATLFLCVVVMSILGSKTGSLHFISLTGGWTGRLWEFLWSGLTAGTFFILGGFCFKFLVNRK